MWDKFVAFVSIIRLIIYSLGKKANGIVILDATEANIYFNKPLIVAAYQGKFIKFDLSHGKLENNTLSLNPFNFYENNLRNL